MATEEQRPGENPGLDDDIDSWVPIAYQPKACPFCSHMIFETEDAYWVVENPADEFYSPYCNEFHYQAQKKIGLWAEMEKTEPTPLEL